MKFRNTLLFLLPLLLLATFTRHATAQIVMYEKTWGGSAGEWGQSVALDSEGNIYVAGQTLSFAVGVSDVFLLKYDSSGNLAWQRTWGADKVDIPTGVAVDSSGIYVTGYTGSFGAGNSDVFILKFNPDGDLLWQRTWGSSEYDEGWGIATQDSYIYISGYTSGFGTGSRDLFLLKFNSTGSIVWQVTWGGAISDWGMNIATDSSGNIYVTGLTESFGAGSYDVLALKFDSSGRLLWQRTWGGSTVDDGFGIATDTSGNAYLTGFTTINGERNWDVYLLKLDPSGGLLWQRTWGGTDTDWGMNVALDQTGNLYLTGLTSSFGAGNNDAFILIFDVSGNLLSQKTWGGGGIDGAWDIAIDHSGNALITGYIAEAPPYALNTPLGSVTIPTLSLGVPTFLTATPTGVIGFPGGAISTPAGSETYAGASDSFLINYGSPPPTTTTTTSTTTTTTTTTTPTTTTTTAPPTPVFRDPRTITLLATLPLAVAVLRRRARTLG